MPTLTIEGFGSFDVPEGQRLVLAIEGCGVDIGHRCGGQARCTTCRVRFIDGEPDVMTKAEHARLTERELLGEARLSCQIVATHPMHVVPLVRMAEMGWSDPGPPPAATVQPEAAWYPKEALD